MSNVNMNVDGSPLTDESANSAPGPGEELQLVGYLDGLIAAAMAGRASRGPAVAWTPEEPPLIGSPPEASEPQRGPITPNPDGADAGSAVTSPSSAGELPPAGRASMSEELAALFRPTEQPAAADSGDPTPPPGKGRVGGGPGAPTTEPSVFLRRLLRQASRPAEFVPTGVDRLDAHLGGGFGPGLHLVVGIPTPERTAFLDTLVWEAVTSERPVVYYTLREGGFAVWERMISTFGSILGGPIVAPASLRARTLEEADIEALTQLDAALQRSVLPFVSIVASIPAYPDALGAFVEDLGFRAREAEERYRRMPLVVLDDLEPLSSLTGSGQLTHVVACLNEVLLGDSTPGVAAAGPPSCRAGGLEAAPAQSTLALESVRPVHGHDFGLVDLQFLVNNQTGWTGALPLLLDHHTGLFSEHPSAPERKSVSQ